MAEDTAARLLLPGAHSNGPGEDGEQLLVWVETFRKNFEEKQNVVP